MMFTKKRSFIAVFVIGFALTACRTTGPKSVDQYSELEAAKTSSQIVGFAFDWDDNIFEMPTKIQLMNRKTHKEVGVSTDEFALIREEVGKKGTKWADFEIRPSLENGSLRFFGDIASDGMNHFQKDIDTALSTKGYHWQGPVWDDFVTAMQQPQTAAQTSIITARSHEPKTIQGALANLVKRKLIANTPPVTSIWAVAAPSFPENFQRSFGIPSPEGGSSNPSIRKAAVMEQILDKINRTKLGNKATAVLSSDGTKKQPLHLWGFSDDDFGNYSKAVTVLQQGVNQGRWSNVKITVFFTGTNHPTEKPRAVVLRKNKEPRPFTETEEWRGVLATNGVLKAAKK